MNIIIQRSAVIWLSIYDYLQGFRASVAEAAEDIVFRVFPNKVSCFELSARFCT
jgi:hypothetical protein